MQDFMAILEGTGIWQAPAEIAVLGAIFALVDLVIDVRNHSLNIDALRLALKLATMIILFLLLDTLPALGVIGNNIIVQFNEPFARGLWLIILVLMPYMGGRFITQYLVNLAMGKLKPETVNVDTRKAKVGA